MTTVPPLELPARDSPRREVFDWHPRAVAAWMDALPMANLDETGPQVHRTLHQLNRWDLPARERLALLERLAPLVDYLVQALRRHYLGRPLPLQGDAAAAAELGRRLLAEMALGHEIAASEIGGGLLRGRRIALALEHAIRLRARELLERWLAYVPAEAGSWQRLHRLYALAESDGVAGHRVRDTDGGGASPATRYKQVLLCAAIGPHRLGQHEITEVWALLGNLADSARLIDVGGDAPATEAVYRVPRGADGPPRAPVDGLDRPDDRVLRTAPLLERLERSLDRIRRRPGRLPRVDPELSARIMLALGAVPRRRHRRLRAGARAEVHAGFRQVHTFLCEHLGRSAEAAERERSRFTAETPRAEAREPPDVWSVLYPNELISSLRAADERPPDHAAAGEPRDHPEERIWQLINISAGGYCLLSAGQAPVRIGVGELVLLRERAGRGLPLQLGAVRWMRSAEEGGLEVGIEILGSDPVPIQLRAEHEDGRFGPVERALLLPRAAGRDQPPTLLAPGPQFAAGRGARLCQGNRETDLALVRERDGTAHYVQLEFQRRTRSADDDGLGALVGGD